MNWPIDLNPHADLDRTLDRLVADELDETERQAVLFYLNANPDGWRRCALAFLEDQAIRSALSSSASQAVKLKRPVVLSADPRRHSTRVLAVTVAAVLVGIATGLGYRVGSSLPARPATQQSDVVESNSPDALELADQARPGQPVGYVSLVNPGEGEALPRRVPVLAATAANEAWLLEQPAAFPDYVKAQWERRGYLVEENRRLVAFDLEDGRHVAVPVDELALDYVGRQPL